MRTKELKRNKGITLIALVITIIVLLILAGVTIATLLGENGILTKATEAKEETENAQQDEEEKIADMEDIIDKATGKIKLTETVSVGDYVEYIPNNVESVVVSKSESGVEDQEIKQENLNWKVLSINDDNVVLISENKTGESISFYGKEGYENCESILHNVCDKLYSGTNGKARSLTLDDVNELLKEDIKKEYEKTNGETTEDWDKLIEFIRYPNDRCNKEYKTIITISPENNEETKEYYDVNAKEWKVLQYGESAQIVHDFYSYDIPKITKENNVLGDILYNSQRTDYWLASKYICVDRRGNISYYPCTMSYEMMNVEVEGVNGRQTTYGGNLLTNEAGYPFRPIVVLNNDVTVKEDASRDGKTAETAWKLE